MNFASMTSAEIVATYNRAASALGEKSVNRFADRKTAERRTVAIVDRVNAKIAEAAARQAAQAKAKQTAEAGEYKRGTCPKCGATSDITCGEVRERNGQQYIVNEHEATCHGCGLQGFQRWCAGVLPWRARSRLLLVHIGCPRRLPS